MHLNYVFLVDIEEVLYTFNGKAVFRYCSDRQWWTIFPEGFAMADFEAKYHTKIVENFKNQISNFNNIQNSCQSDKWTNCGKKVPKTCFWWLNTYFKRILFNYNPNVIHMVPWFFRMSAGTKLNCAFNNSGLNSKKKIK